MPYLRLPDGSYYEVPKGMNENQAFAEAYNKYPEAFGVKQETPAAKRTGIGSDFKRGLEQLLSTGRTAAEATFGDKQAAMEAALQRKNVIAEKYGEAPGWEEVKKAYQDRGLLSAIGEYVSQVPGAIAEQAPQIGTSVGAARLGAMAGPIGAGVGVAAPSYTQAYGALLERQAEEQKQRGEPVDVDRAKAAALAVPYAALDVAATFIPLGKGMVKSIFGEDVAKLLSRGATKEAEELAARRLASEKFLKSAAVGTVKGAAVEVPTEIGQQALERLQAGLPLLDESAMAEYGQTAFQVSKLGPLGAIGRYSDKAAARARVAQADEEKAMAAAKAASEAEAARKADPEYALKLGDEYEGLVQQAKDLLAARGKKLAKDATDEQRDLFAQQTQQLKELQAKIKELAPDYKEIKTKLPGLREERRVAAMTPQQYYYEQMGMKSDEELAAEEAPAPSEQDPMQAWLAQTAAADQRPATQLQRDFDEALGGLRHFDMLNPVDAADVISRDPVLMQKVFSGELKVPEFSAKEGRELNDILKLQLKELGKQMSQGREEAAQTREKVEGEKAALQRIAENKMPGTEAQTQIGLTKELERFGEEMKPGVTTEPGLQKQNYRTKAQEHQEEASNALLAIQEAKTDIEKGNTLDTPFASKRKFASTTTDLLRQRIEENKQKYIDGLLNSIANLRAAENSQPIPSDVAKLADAQIRSVLDAYSTGQATEAQLKRQLDVIQARLMTYRPALQKQPLETGEPIERQSAYREAQKITEERGETAKTLEGQLRRQRDYVGGLIDRALAIPLRSPLGMTLPRDVRAALGNVRTAIEDGTATRDVLDQAEDIAGRALRGQVSREEAAPLNAALRSMSEAQGPGIEGGQRSLFGEEDLGIVRATAANFKRLLNSKQVAELRAMLPRIEKIVVEATPAQDRPGVDAAFYQQRIDALEKQIQDAKDSLEDLGEASWESLMQTRSALPEEVRVARQKLYALLQEQNKLERDREAAAKAAKPVSTRPPYEAAQAQNKASKLKQKIEDKQVNILQTIRELTAHIKEQRKAAIYDPIIAQFEARAQDYEAKLANVREALPEGGAMSPELDALYNEAADLEAQIETARTELAKVRDRAETAESNDALLAAADARVVKDKERLAELQKKLDKVDLVGEDRRTAQAEAAKLRRDTAVAEGQLRELKELNSRQEEARQRRLTTGEGMRKLQRTVIPVERTDKLGRKSVVKERESGLPVQQKKTIGAYAERPEAQGLGWKSSKPAKAKYAQETLAIEEAKPKAEALPKTMKVGAAEKMQKLSKTSRTLARQATVTNIKPRPERKEPLRTPGKETKQPGEVALKRTMTKAERAKLEADFKAGMAFRTAKTGAEVVDPTEAKARIVEVKSRMPKGMNLIYEPTLEGMKPETLAMLVENGYKEGEGFKGVVLPDGTIVVVGDQHANMTDLEETLFHEMVGHYGIDTVIGLNKLKEFAHATDLEKLAKRLGGNNLWYEAVAAMNFATEQKKDPDLAALREIIAYTAQQRITESFKTKAGRWLQQLVGVVRAAMRAMGFKNMTDMSTSDVFYAIKRANAAYNDRTLGPYRAADGNMAFRTKREPSRYGKSFIAQEKSAKDKLLGNLLGLSGRVQFVDKDAALDEVLKRGLSAGVISDLEAEQALHYLRFAPQANAFATQALSNGPLSLVKQTTKRGAEFIYKSSPGANMVQVADALQKSGIKNGTELEAMFTIYMAGKRAKQVGWEKLNFESPAETEAEYKQLMAELRGNDKARAAFEEAAKIYKEYNNGLMDFMVQTGYLSESRAAQLKDIDYVPFYRADKDGNLNLFVDKERPIRIANIKDEPILHELVGDNAQILPIFTSSAQNAFVLTRMALRNQTVKDSAMLLKRLGVASKMGKGAGPASSNTIRFKVKGEDYFAVVDTDMYGVPAELIVKGMEGIKTTLPMAIKLMGKPANILRQFVTRAPTYALKQIIRDPLTAALTTGVDGVPVMNAMKEMASMVAGRSEAERKLMESGAISSNVLTGGEEDMAKALREMSLGKPGWAKLFAKMDAIAMQGDAATRAVVYKDSIAKGMSEMQALTRTLESMNFSRRGLSPTMQMLSTVIPFFNAQIQGLDVLYRAFKGEMPYSKQLQIRQKLYTRGLLLAAGTLAYAAAMEDDEAYKTAKPEERLGNWFVYTPFADEPIRVPIPFELGYLFKALPEAVWNMASKDERASDITKGMGKLIGLSNPFALPQAIKPVTEVILGRSFFGGDIESQRELTKMQPTERYREGTTEVAKLLGKITGDAGLTPIKIDYLIRGYTGGLGVALASLANPILNTEADAVEKPTMKASKLPFIGGLFQPVEGRGTLDAAYERMLEIQQAQGTYDQLLTKGKRAEAEEFLDKYRNKLVRASLSGEVQRDLGELAKAKREVIASNRTTQEKDELIKKIEDRQMLLAKRFLAATS